MAETLLRSLDIAIVDKTAHDNENRETFDKGQYFQADCLATDAVGNWVYITGDDVSGIFQVTKVDVTDKSTLPAIGVIVEKTTSTRCRVQTYGEVTGLGTLTPGSRYFIGTDSNISTSLPTPPALGTATMQVVGVAISAEILLVLPGQSLLVTRLP